jgi:NAD(P)-dependent dehydrogenase (short-subunit alcohol dehydrogenase family)
MGHEFQGQKLIVVGGSSGIGRAVAQLVLELGGKVVVIGRRVDKTIAATKELTSYGPVIGEPADITNRAERIALMDRLEAQHGDATMLVNAAGVFLPKPFLSTLGLTMIATLK